MQLSRRLFTILAIGSISGVPVGLNPAAAVESTAPAQQERLRLSRTPFDSKPVKFTGPPTGVSLRWLRNMRKPAFCPYVLCHGTCSDVIGQYTIGGSCAATESADEPVPCGLRTSLLFHSVSAGCCASSPGTLEGCTTSGDSCATHSSGCGH